MFKVGDILEVESEEGFEEWAGLQFKLTDTTIALAGPITKLPKNFPHGFRVGNIIHLNNSYIKLAKPKEPLTFRQALEILENV